MNRIRVARKAKSLTMRKLGEIVGVTESAISMYETGKREPDNATLVNIADSLDVSVDYLLLKTDDPTYGNTEDTKEKPTARSDGPDESLISMLAGLNAQDAQRVRDFVQGLKAARKEEQTLQK